jgi:putative NADPH-quinone reductase
VAKPILIIDGHPDPDVRRFCHTVADTYERGARAAGHKVRRLTLAELELPMLRSRQEWENGLPSESVRRAQEAIAASEHLVIIYPLWLGSMPALLKAFFEQTFRPGFAIQAGARTLWPGKLNGKSARIVITMGMPALIYRWFFMAHSLKSFERNILRFAGIRPIRESLIGSVEGKAAARTKWLARIEWYGRAGI